MKDDLELERKVHISIKSAQRGDKIDLAELQDAVTDLICRNLERAKAARAMKRELETARFERDLWRKRFEILRKVMARAAQPETWEVRQ